MLEPRQLVADSFAEIAMADHLNRLQPGAPSIAAVLAAIEGPEQKQRLEGTLEQTGCFSLSVDASSVPVKTFWFFLVTKRSDNY